MTLSDAWALGSYLMTAETLEELVLDSNCLHSSGLVTIIRSLQVRGIVSLGDSFEDIMMDPINVSLGLLFVGVNVHSTFSDQSELVGYRDGWP